MIYFQGEFEFLRRCVAENEFTVIHCVRVMTHAVENILVAQYNINSTGEDTYGLEKITKITCIRAH